MAWEERHFEVPLVGSVNKTAQEFKVAPPQLLISENTVADIAGTLRQAPSAQAGSTALAEFGSGGNADKHSFGGQTVYGMATRNQGQEAFMVTRNGIAVIVDEDTQFYPCGMSSAPITTPREYMPAAKPVPYLTAEQFCDPNAYGIYSCAFLEHNGAHLWVYFRENSAQIMRWHARNAETGQVIGQGMVENGKEPYATNSWDDLALIAGSSNTCRAVYRESNTSLESVKFTISSTSCVVASTTTISPTSPDTAATWGAAVEDRVAADGSWFMVYQDTVGDIHINKYGDDDVLDVTRSASVTNAEATKPKDIDIVDGGSTDLVVAAYMTTSGTVDYVRMPRDLTTATVKTSAIAARTVSGNWDAASVCGDGNGFIILGALRTSRITASARGLRVSAYNSSDTKRGDTYEVHGPTVVSRLFEMDGIPSIAMNQAYNTDAVGDDTAPLCNEIFGLTWRYNGTNESSLWREGASDSIYNFRLVPRARYGNDYNSENPFPQKPRKVSGEERWCFAYDADFSGGIQAKVRGVTLDCDKPHKMRFVEDGQCTIMSGALLTCYDGHQHNSYDFSWIPDTYQTTTGGDGPQLPAGTYSFRWCAAWYDADGRIHRSQPSSAEDHTYSLNDQALLRVRVSDVSGEHNNHIPYLIGTLTRDSHYFLECYSQGPSDSQHYQVGNTNNDTLSEPDWRLELEPSEALTNGGTGAYAILGYDEVGESAGTSAVLYTEFGNELPNDPSPPCIDLEIVSDRLWLLDAEDPESYWYSKPRAEGRAWEFSAAQKVRAPGGKGVALSQINGLPLILRRDGLLVVYGDGPDATGANGTFSVPRKLDGVPGCTVGHTVVRTPFGVVYQSDRALYLLKPDLTHEQIGASVEALVGTDFVGATYDEDNGRVVWWRDRASATDDSLCWSVRDNVWSTWEHDAETVVQLSDGAVYTAHKQSEWYTTRYDETGSGTGYTNGRDANGTWTVETPWLRPAGFEGRIQWRSFTVTCERTISALTGTALTVSVYFDDDAEGSPETFTISATNARGHTRTASGGVGVFSFSAPFKSAAHSGTTRARSLKVKIEDGEGQDINRLLSLRVDYATDGGRTRRDFVDGENRSA